MPAANMTYTSLVNDITVYVDRNDDPFLAQIPRFIMQAENRIASEVQNLGMQRVVTSTMTVGQPVIAKPARWRETISFNYGTGTAHNTRTTLFERTYEWVRAFASDPTVLGAPRYYADYNQEHFIVGLTPDYAYPYELVYRERLEPLSDENQTNWLTEYAPQLILAACMLEAQPFLKNMEMIAMWQSTYDRSAQALTKEDNSRVTDRSSIRK
jgi:hypothetical protein